MKFPSSFAVLALLSVFVEASSLHDGLHRFARHNKIAPRGGSNSRCKVRPSSTAAPPPPPASPSPSNDSTNYSNNNNSGGDNTNSGGSNNNNNPAANAANGLIHVSSNCGPDGATKDITATSGPNGALDWLNCGINDSGWQPPYITLGDIIAADLSDAVTHPDSPFGACRDFVWAFNQYGNQYGIPPIILASFAMQESTCNPQTVGGAGEQGLMQLTWDKCQDAPGGDCKDIAYNVETGAKYFSGNLASNGGDLLLTIGEYNGWHRGMTYADATAARWTCCRCQNNLDYLHQFLNGWVQNYDAYKHNLGTYFNLNVCH